MTTVFHGDCLDLLTDTADESVRLVLTSPPYNIGKEYEQRQPLEDYLQFHRTVIAECVRVLVPGGSLVWQVGNYINPKTKELIPLDVLFWHELKNAGLTSRNRIVWTYGHGLHSIKRFSGRHETLLWFTKGDNYVYNLDDVRVPQKYPSKRHFKGPKKGQLSGNPLGKNPGDVWNITNVKHNHPEKTEHPCSFPLALADRCVLAFSNPGDIVLDPFGGAGTTVVSADRHGRSGVMAEIDEKYVSIARRRLET